MMLSVFFLLTILGGGQLFFWFRSQQRTWSLRHSRGSSTRYILIKTVYRHSLSRRINKTWDDWFRHLAGSRTIIMKHGVSVLMFQIGFFYINQQYLHLNMYIVHLLVLYFTIYILYIRSKKKMRQDFEASFSEALNIINSSLRAGNSVVQGVEQCGEKMSGMVGREFLIISRRLAIGEDPESVFMESWRRFPYQEYYFFIIAVIINMKGGGQSREVISRLGALISAGRIMERKKYAMTSEARMSVKILAIIPMFFILFMKYQSPENFDILLYHPTGQIILYYSVGSIILGLFIVWIMMNKI